MTGEVVESSTVSNSQTPVLFCPTDKKLGGEGVARASFNAKHNLPPRPRMILVLEHGFVQEIWVEGRAPLITIHDYDWGETDPDPNFDAEGFAFSPIRWRQPAWALGLSLHPPIKETDTMAKQDLKTIPLSELKVSKLNMRHSRKKPDISDILSSIRTHGLRQSLLVRREGAHFGVVAGRRRLFALKQIGKETGRDIKVPCIVMRSEEDAEAIEASILENVARLPATEMEQFEAFGNLAQSGRTAPEIAEYFGITELTVRRVLALANLSERIRELCAQDEIDRATVHALTLATPAQQDQWMELFLSEKEREPRGRNCKAWIAGGAAITTDKALFDIKDYAGEIIADLFGDAGVFASSAEFWESQSNALADIIDTYKENGWSDVRVLERGQYFQSWDHQKRSRTKGGNVYVEVRHDGTICFHEGYLNKTDARKLERAPDKTGDGDRVVRPEMTKAMATYLSEHRRLATGASLLDKPAIAQRLVVAHMLVGSNLWNLRTHHPRAKNDAVMQSYQTAKAATKIDAAEAKVRDMLEAHGIEHLRRSADDHHLCEVFAALLGMDDEEVSFIMTTSMVASLDAGTSVIEAIAVAAETDMATYWKPDQVFLDLLRDKAAINAMIADVASPNTAKDCLTETAKVQKSILAKHILGDKSSANAGWRPAWMHVPPSGILEGAPSHPSDTWERIAPLFSDERAEDAKPETMKTLAA